MGPEDRMERIALIVRLERLVRQHFAWLDEIPTVELEVFDVA